MTHLHPDHAFFIESRTEKTYAKERNEDDGIDVTVIEEPMDLAIPSPDPTHPASL